jgi:hypothetical protein
VQFSFWRIKRKDLINKEVAMMKLIFIIILLFFSTIFVSGEESFIAMYKSIGVQMKTIDNTFAESEFQYHSTVIRDYWSRNARMKNYTCAIFDYISNIDLTGGSYIGSKNENVVQYVDIYGGEEKIYYIAMYVDGIVVVNDYKVSSEQVDFQKIWDLLTDKRDIGPESLEVLGDKLNSGELSVTEYYRQVEKLLRERHGK